MSNALEKVIPGLDRLQQRPMIDQIDARTLELIRKQVAQNCTDAEIGYFLELAAHYDLDPFAHEIWCSKDRRGKLLVMVGRDGLRKVGYRNGISVQGAVVHADDDYAVEFVEYEQDAKPGEWEAHGRMPFHRVTHRHKGMGAQRGAIVGAWCRAFSQATGAEGGFFEAPLSEYKPGNASEYSPWSKQTSIMIYSAAERAAQRMATPLGGLLVEGEDESAQAAWTASESTGEPQGLPLPPEVEAILARAMLAGHAGLADRAVAEAAIGKRPQEAVDRWVANAEAELERFAQEQQPDEPEPEDAEVVAEVEVAMDQDGYVAVGTADNPDALLDAVRAHTQATTRAAEVKVSDEMLNDAVPTAAERMESQLMLNRLARVREARGEAQAPEDEAQLDEELDYIEGWLTEHEVEIPAKEEA